MNGQDTREYDLQERMIEFVVRILKIVEALPETRAANHIASQLVRSGTSPAANYGEAQSAESRKDFIHKMKVALKELRETLIWLLIIQRKPLIESADKLNSTTEENRQLIAIFVTSIATVERNLNQK